MGDAAWLVEVDDHHKARALADAVRAASWPTVAEVVGGLRTVLVVLDPNDPDRARLAERIGRLEPAGEPSPGPAVTLPAVLDGPDLEEVGRQVTVGAAGVRTLFTRAQLEVAMVGFAPGFAYLVGLPEPLREVPRRASPRPSVPAGSVAVGGGFAGVYPQASPGGWQLIGRTSEAMFDPDRPPYVRLRPGDRVRFRGVTELPPFRSPARAPLCPEGAPVWAVLEPGLQTTLQDGGRRGLAHLGVPGAGPADERAHRLANQLVGNPPDAPALEATAKGPVLRCLLACHVALVGHGGPPAGSPMLLLDGRPVPAATVVPAVPGQELEVRSTGTGLRAYLAMDGGLAGRVVLGSHGTDLLSGLGGGALQPGDLLGRLHSPARPRSHLAPPGPSSHLSRGCCRLRVLPGPHPEWFDPGVLGSLAGRTFRVEPTSNRIGLRLHPDGPPLERANGELDSEGMVTGAVQVPPDGCPVVLGPDHATLGGYPVLAVVIRADRWRLGQCRPGDAVELVPVDRDEAHKAWSELGRTDRWAVGRYPIVVE